MISSKGEEEEESSSPPSSSSFNQKANNEDIENIEGRERAGYNFEGPSPRRPCPAGDPASGEPRPLRQVWYDHVQDDQGWSALV